MTVHNQNVSGSSGGQPARVQETAPASNSTAPAKSSAPTSSSDRVELSGALGSLSRAVSSDNANRASQVSALAQQYQSGGYQANAAGAAKGIVSEAVATGVK